jgi:hypothetical protein
MSVPSAAYNSAVKLPRWATALDIIAIAMALLAISTFMFGGFRLPIPGGRLSVTDWIRPALWTAVALVVRHALIRRQPLPRRVFAAILDWWRQPNTKIVLPIHLATRGGVLAVGFLAVVLIGFPPEAASRWRIYSNDFLDLPARWDTGWYLGIAMDGYDWNPSYRPEQQQNIAFFPAVPMLMRYLSPVFGRQPLWTGVGVSLVAFFIGLLYLLRLARQETGDEAASVAAVTFMAAYPFAVFFSAAYTEGLFFLTIVAAVYHFRNDRLWTAGLWGLAAGLTRPNGCLLSVVLGLMAIANRTPRVWQRLVAASAPGVGMLIFSAYIYTLTGNPFQWAAQNVAWGRVYRSLDSVVADRIGFISTYGLYGYASTQTLDFFYLLAVLFALGAVWPVYRRFGIAYAAMLVVNVLPPIAAGGLLSMGRVTSILFPAFMWMGVAVPARHRLAWVAVFGMLQGFVAVMFFTWRPLY